MAGASLDEIRQIVEQAVWDSPHAYVLLLIAFAAPALGAFLGAYARKRGETAAIKTDLERIKSQLAATTRVAEEVKASIGFEDWHARESLALKRDRLEEFYRVVWDHELIFMPWWQHMSFDKQGQRPQSGERELARLRTLAALYFPHLQALATQYSIKVLGMSTKAIEFSGLYAADPVGTADQISKYHSQEYPIMDQIRRSLLDGIAAEMPRLMSISNRG